MPHSHQFCVSPADGNPVMAVWNSDHAVNINLLRWVVATRMEYALRTGHCSVADFDPHDCGGTTIYYLDARASAIANDTLYAIVGGSASEMIAALMTIEVIIVAERSDPIRDTRVAEPVPNHADAAHARFQQIWEKIHQAVGVGTSDAGTVSLTHARAVELALVSREWPRDDAVGRLGYRGYWWEYQANQRIATLLLPLCLLRPRVEELLRVHVLPKFEDAVRSGVADGTIRDLSDQFDVSQKADSYWLQAFGYVPSAAQPKLAMESVTRGTVFLFFTEASAPSADA